VQRGWDKKGQEGRKAGGQEVKNKGYMIQIAKIQLITYILKTLLLAFLPSGPLAFFCPTPLVNSQRLDISAYLNL